MTAVMTPSQNTITAGQIGKLQDLFAARLRKSGLDSEPVQQVLATHGDAIADEMVAAVSKRVEAMLVLVPREAIAIKMSAKHNPDTYYRNRDGLWVWDGMRSLVVAKAKPLPTGTAFDLSVAELGKDANDGQIEGTLCADHLFDESAVCAIIAELIGQQPCGKTGHLLNNGYANLFYTSSCVVRVRWGSAYRRWYVITWRRDDDGWSAGFRVFSPAN